jgi:hypothetical protein
LDGFVRWLVWPRRGLPAFVVLALLVGATVGTPVAASHAVHLATAHLPTAVHAVDGADHLHDHEGGHSRSHALLHTQIDPADPSTPMRSITAPAVTAVVSTTSMVALSRAAPATGPVQIKPNQAELQVWRT